MEEKNSILLFKKEENDREEDQKERIHFICLKRREYMKLSRSNLELSDESSDLNANPSSSGTNHEFLTSLICPHSDQSCCTKSCFN